MQRIIPGHCGGSTEGGFGIFCQNVMSHSTTKAFRFLEHHKLYTLLIGEAFSMNRQYTRACICKFNVRISLFQKTKTRDVARKPTFFL